MVTSFSAVKGKYNIAVYEPATPISHFISSQMPIPRAIYAQPFVINQAIPNDKANRQFKKNFIILLNFCHKPINNFFITNYNIFTN